MSSLLWVFQALALLLLKVRATPGHYQGRWSLKNTEISCPDDGICFYNFTVSEGLDPLLHGRIFSQNCSFMVNSENGVPASLMNFTSKSCEQEPSTGYKINGGWDPHGFITMCVTNTNESQWAFFSFESEEVINTRDEKEVMVPAYSWGTFDMDGNHGIGIPIPDHFVAPHAVSVRQDESETWEITHFLRVIDREDIIFQLFNIFDGAFTWTCLLSFPINMMTESFYDRPCFVDDFFVSWGYKPEDDSAVMTVISPDRTQRAFFGLNFINKRRLTVDQIGPSAVERGSF